MTGLTPNEATIFAAIAAAVIAPLLSIVTSILTTRYTLKHGPNYETQISDLNKSLSALAETQGQLVRQQTAAEEAAEERRVVEEQRREAERWKPEARLQSDYEGTDLKNELILKSPQEFSVLGVALLSAAGAKLADIPADQQICSTGFRIHVRHADILKLINGDIEFGRTGSCSGALRYRVRRGITGYDGTLSFRAQQDIRNNTVWVRLMG